MPEYTDDGLFPEEKGVSGLDYVWDGLAGIPRGAEGFLKSGYSLLDTLSFDVLPDWNKRVLGESRTGLGSTVELITNFAFGFAAAPLAVGTLGASIGLLGRLPGLGIAARVGSSIGKAGTALAGTGLVAHAARGAVADFAFLEAQDSILATLAPALGFEDELGDFFGADAVDLSFFEGRLRNAMEGLVLGTAIDGLLLGAKKIRAFRNGKSKGADAAVEAVERVKAPSTKTSGISEKELKKLTDEAEKASREQTRALAKKFEDPVHAEKAAEELLSKYGRVREVTRPLVKGDLAEVDGPGLSNVELFIADLGRGDVDGIALFRDGRVAEVMALLRQAVQDDIDLPGLSHLTGRKAQSADDILNDAVGTRADQTHSTYAAAAEQADRLLIDAADDTRRAGNAYVAGQIFLRGMQQSIDNSFIQLKNSGSTEGFIEAVTEAALVVAGTNRAIQSLSSEFGLALGKVSLFKRKLLDIDGAATLEFSQLDDLMKTVRDQAMTKRGAEKKAKAVMERYLILKKEAGKDRAFGSLSHGQKVMGILQELYLNNLLGGVRTLTVTGIGGATMLFMRAAERYVGSLTGGQFAKANREWRRYWSQVSKSYREGIKMAHATFKNETNVWDPSQASMWGSTQPRSINLGGRDPISVGAIDDKAKGVLAEMPRAMGRLIRTPQRLIGGIDQFYRQIGGRAEIAVQLDVLARKTGLVDEIEIDLFINQRMKVIVNEGRVVTKGSIQEEAFEKSVKAGHDPGIARSNAQNAAATAERVDTEGLLDIGQAGIEAGNKIAFTQKFDRDSLSGRIQGIINHLPAARFIIPFFSTPVQIIGATLERSLLALPVDAARTLYGAEVKGIFKRLKDPVTRNETRGQLMLSAASAGLIFDMFDQGLITGAGPVPRAERSALEATGWRPYSVKVDGVYYSYARLDPIASILGLYTDMREAISMHDPAQRSVVESMFNAVHLTVNGNFIEKSYMRGLSEFLDVFDSQNGTRNIKRYMSSIGANIAGPGLLKNFSEFGRPNMVQVHDTWSRIAKQWSFLPGIDNPEPFRNILGEPKDPRKYLGGGFLPIEYAETTSDVISNEMARLSYGISPDPFTKNGANLKEFKSVRGQTAYDRWQQLRGSVKVGGRTLNDSLSRKIRSRRYLILSDETSEMRSLGLKSPKEMEIRTILSGFRRKAYLEMLKEFPELADREKLRKKTESLARQGRLRR